LAPLFYRLTLSFAARSVLEMRLGDTLPPFLSPRTCALSAEKIMATVLNVAEEPAGAS